MPPIMGGGRGSGNGIALGARELAAPCHGIPRAFASQ